MTEKKQPEKTEVTEGAIFDFVANGMTAEMKGLSAFNAETFFSEALALAVEFVPVGNGGVWVRELTGLQRDKYEESLISGKGKHRRVSLQGARARLIVMSCIEGPDPALVLAGKAEKPDASKAKALFRTTDIPRINSMGASFVEPIAEAARRLSGITEDEEEAAEDLKNED